MQALVYEERAGPTCYLILFVILAALGCTYKQEVGMRTYKQEVGMRIYVIPKSHILPTKS